VLSACLPARFLLLHVRLSVSFCVPPSLLPLAAACGRPPACPPARSLACCCLSPQPSPSSQTTLNPPAKFSHKEDKKNDLLFHPARFAFRYLSTQLTKPLICLLVCKQWREQLLLTLLLPIVQLTAARAMSPVKLLITRLSVNAMSSLAGTGPSFVSRGIGINSCQRRFD
jgi:hypothetical protein